MLSLHAAVLFVKTQPDAGLHVSVVHALLSLQTTAVPPWQVPPPHVSGVVQAFPSLHAAVLFVCVHVPVTQVSSVHGLASLHSVAVVHATHPGITGCVQVPPEHTSFVHVLLSVAHAAVLFVPRQAPAPLHVSPDVQTLLSLHAAVLFVKTQPDAGLQLSVVHVLLSLQRTAAPPWQVPAPQMSPVVHAFPSLHAAVLFVCVHDPVTQVSSVHGLASLQSVLEPQTPGRTFMPPGVNGPIVVVFPDFSQSAPEFLSTRGSVSKREILTPATSPLLGFGPVQGQSAGGGLTEGPVSKAT